MHMESAKILDWNPLTALALYPEKDEAILWAGQPNLSSHFPGVSGLGFLNRFWISYYVGIFWAFRYSLKTYDPLPALLAILAVILLQVLPFLLQYYTIRHTSYVVTNKRIVLSLCRFFILKTHVLRYGDFQKSTFVMNSEGTNTGTVYLMTGKDVGFWTYEMTGGERRHHPTLEGVDGAEELVLRIEGIRRGGI